MIPPISTAGYSTKQISSTDLSAGANTAPNSSNDTSQNFKSAPVETNAAVTAPVNVSTSPKLPTEETAERTDRVPPPKEAPTGPKPSFDESLLERQARTAFDPPDRAENPASADSKFAEAKRATAPQPSPVGVDTAS